MAFGVCGLMALMASLKFSLPKKYAAPAPIQAAKGVRTAEKISFLKSIIFSAVTLVVVPCARAVVVDLLVRMPLLYKIPETMKKEV